MASQSTSTLFRGDRIAWCGEFGYVSRIMHAVRGDDRVAYARLSLDSGASVLLGPESDTRPLSLVWTARGNLRLVPAPKEAKHG